MEREITVTTGARLHFGFLAHRKFRFSGDGWQLDIDPRHPDIRARNYGGVGLMIDTPGCAVDAGPVPAGAGPSNDAIVCPDELRSRIAWHVRRYRRCTARGARPPFCRLEVRRFIPAHAGLGSGSQLGMAVSQALDLLWGDGAADAVTLARRAGRGKRSAIGIHGFARGGFLVDGGKRAAREISPLLARVDVPPDWRFLLVSPGSAAAPNGAGFCGRDEVDTLERTRNMPLGLTERLCRLVLMEILPSLAAGRVDDFGEALYEYGHAVGTHFRSVQGGEYADPRMAALVAFVRSLRYAGVAQTSWGPTVAVVCHDEPSAVQLQQRILADSRWSDCWTRIARPLNTGAAIEIRRSEQPGGISRER